jgi:hypothetical protein
MAKKHKATRKPRRDLNTPHVGGSEHLWLIYGREYNKIASGTGFGIVPLPNDPKPLAHMADPWLPADEVAKMKLAYFAKIIDMIWPLAEYGFDTARAQRTRQRRSRGKLDQLMKLVLMRHPDYTNKQLWESVANSGDLVGLTINIDDDGGSMEWDEQDSDKPRSGNYKWRSFTVRMSEHRAEIGILKRPRRSKVSDTRY